MPSSKLFHRNPREIPFLLKQAGKVLQLADQSSTDLAIREDDDFGFMALQFLYKQIQHMESLLAIVPRRDVGLMARTMIDGLYQLLWASHEPVERARRWRSFAIVHDWRLIQGRLKEGIDVDSAQIAKNTAALKAFGDVHRLKKAKPDSTDPYHKKWYGGVSLADLADAVGRELYDGPYAELSDWEHWGVSGIGESITREGNHVVVETNSERATGLSLVAAFQCLFQTLEVADSHLSLNLRQDLQAMGDHFIATLESFRQG